MAEQTLPGVVLRYANFSESSRMLTLFTPGEGLVSVCAKGCRRMKSPLRNACEAFVFGEFDLFQGKGGVILRGATVTDSFFPLREDLDALTAACEMRDVLLSLVTEQDPQPELFALFVRCLGFLCQKPCDALKLRLHFELNAMALSGYQPVLGHCARCGGPLGNQPGFSPREGGALCTQCAPATERISPALITLLRHLGEFTPDRLDVITLSPAQREGLESLWASYRSYHLERRLPEDGFARRTEIFLSNHEKK